MNDNNNWSKKRVMEYFNKHNISSKIQSIQSVIHFKLSKFKAFERYSILKQKIILTTLKEENRLDELEKNLYFFTKIRVDKLPRSYWENVFHQQVYFTENFTQKKVNDFKKIIRKIKTIEKSIIQKGYDVNYPIFIKLEDVKNNIIYVNGGHHRIQAIRNLVGNHKINKNYTIPSLIVVSKKKIGYQKFNFNGLIDYSYILDVLINDVKAIKNNKTDKKGYYLIDFIFKKGCNYLYVKKIQNTLYVEVPIIMFGDRLKRLPILFMFFKKYTNLVIKVKESNENKIDNVLKKLVDEKLIHEIY